MGCDLSFVTVRVVDKDGITAPRADNRIRFTIDGPGEIVATDNGDPTSFEPFQAPERKAFNGLVPRDRPRHAGTARNDQACGGVRLSAGRLPHLAQRGRQVVESALRSNDRSGWIEVQS